MGSREAASHPRLHRARSARRRSTSSSARAERVRARRAVRRHCARARWSRRRAQHGVRADRARRRRRRRARRRGVDRAARCSPAPRGSCGSSPSPSADLVLNAIVGSAGLGPTIVALTEGIDVALANKESLVVGGELVTALAEATGAQLIPVDSEHSALHQLLAGEPPGTVEQLVITASGGPFRGRTRAELEDVTRRAGAQAPDLGDGRQDHDRLRDADEQGPRGDRGPPPVRHAVRPHRRRRAPAVDHPRARAAVRRRDAGAPGLPGHARADRLRAAPPGARRRAGADARPRRRSARSTFEAPDLDAFPCLRLAREAARRRRHRAVRAQRRQRGRRPRVPRRPAGVHGHPGRDRGHARARSPPRRVHGFESLYEADARGARARRRAGRQALRA